MKRLKLSKYNVLSPVPELNECLLYNTASGGLIVIDSFQSELLHHLVRTGAFEIDAFEERDFLEYLLKNRFVVDFGENEMQTIEKHFQTKQLLARSMDFSSINLTVATTITCNMGCPYCFEVIKPSITLKKNEHLGQIVQYIEEMILKSPVKHWKSFNVTWYGGEPLINTDAIEKLTPRFLALCEKHNLSYHSTIVTNGLLLTEKTWHMLEDNKVSTAQITIDGPQHVHEKHRPLKGGGERKNYHQILENLTHTPDRFKINVRMNVDKEVAAGFEEFFRDLNSYGLWPQRARNIAVHTAWLRTYEEAHEENTSSRLTADEYFDVMQGFRKLKLKLYNEYADSKALPRAKLQWLLPEFQDECATWTSPYGIVIDPEGFIHKCWETVHEKNHRIHHVSDGYQVEDFSRYINYSRYHVNEMCNSCTYLPVCDQLSCSIQAEKFAANPPCTYWKHKTVESLKEQYLFMKQNPELVSLPQNMMEENTGHSNK